MLDEDDARLASAEHLEAVSLRLAAAQPMFSDNTWDTMHRYAEDALDRLVLIWRPWAKVDREQREKQQAKRLISSWEKAYGELDSPETQQKIAEVVEALQRMAEQEPPEIRQFRAAPRPPSKFARRR